MAGRKKTGSVGNLYLGISNVVIPGNKTTFPPAFREKSRLHYYSSLYNSVEINSSFYKTPLRSTYEKWQADVPNNFRFSIKLSREITHTRELKYDPALVDPFLQAADGLGNKKGALLVQFPGKITFDYFNHVEKILEHIHASPWQTGWDLAVEFRHPSWYMGETTELLNEYNAGLVLHDIPKSKWMEAVTAAPHIYIRFHGPTGNYRDSYSPRLLAERAAEINQWRSQGKTIYAYFNNTIDDAFENARSFQRLTGLDAK
ncbi:MAG: DUF72 domain-containing protein [Chitinophagaceae bacterium]|nr:MAG: DUF72 domain-containing protein [Chitinophagaceae bacterium]